MFDVPASAADVSAPDRAIVFHPDHPQQLECAAYEPTGVLLLWNEQLDRTEVSLSQQLSLAALILNTHFNAEHIAALQRAMVLASGDDHMRLAEVLGCMTLQQTAGDSENSRRALSDPSVQ